MKIKSSLAAFAVVFSVGLIFAPAADAKENKDAKKDEKPPAVKVIVQPGDSLSAIADAHSTTYVRIFNANEFIVDPNLINPGEEIRIPTADEVLPERLSAPVFVARTTPTAVLAPVASVPAPVPQANYSSNTSNTYYRGYCTWYAKERRPDLPNMLGNGGQWVASAAARGFAIGTSPRVGAIAEIPGHVAYVEAVNGDGTIVISEMNGPAGFGVVGTRTVPASQYRYIY